jgi:hypothetical protein
VTLVLDDVSQAFFDCARQRWFPASLNRVPAHVTLFHQLPGARIAELRAQLAGLCADRQPAHFVVTGVRFLGRGVAYVLHMPEIAALRDAVRQQWIDVVTVQDRQPWRPHVTIQNKVPTEEARTLHQTLAVDFVPFAGSAVGIALWRYRGGPWESSGRELFRLPGAVQPTAGEVERRIVKAPVWRSPPRQASGKESGSFLKKRTKKL